MKNSRTRSADSFRANKFKRFCLKRQAPSRRFENSGQKLQPPLADVKPPPPSRKESDSAEGKNAAVKEKLHHGESGGNTTVL